MLGQLPFVFEELATLETLTFDAALDPEVKLKLDALSGHFPCPTAQIIPHLQHYLENLD